MRVAIVTSFPRDPETPHGGVEAVSVVLVKALAAFDDLDVHVITNHRDQDAASWDAWGGATIHRLPARSRHMLTSVVGRDAAEVRRYVERLHPDVIHAHDIYGPMLRGLPIPRVFTIHGFIHADTLVSGGTLPWLRSRMWRWVEHRGWGDQDRIVSISPYVREHLPGGIGAVVHDIDNPVREEFFQVRRADSGTTIFTASVINKRKNVLALLEAMARLKAKGVDANLRVAGPITDAAYGQAVRDAIRRHGLGDRVDLLGVLRTSAIRDELVTCSAFALASLEENSPMGIEEAMAAGVPVVTSNRCGMPYLVRNGETGFLVDPHDAGDIADALAALITSPALRTRMGQAARVVAQDRFHPSSVARRTRDVYLQLRYGRQSATADDVQMPELRAIGIR